MKPAGTQGWIEIVDSDIDAVRRLLISDPKPNLALAAYHCQQAAEKLVKALLGHLALDYPRGSGGHDIRRLVECLPDTHPLHAEARGLAHLTPWATAFRYPADDPFTAEPLPEVAKVQQEMEAVTRFRNKVAAELEGCRRTNPS